MLIKVAAVTEIESPTFHCTDRFAKWFPWYLFSVDIGKLDLTFDLCVITKLVPLRPPSHQT